VECVDHNAGGQECDGNAKLDLVVVSHLFEGLPLLKRHRLVNDCLAGLMPKIHALSMKTMTPLQYDAKQNA
jgi:stress-induced morphogen